MILSEECREKSAGMLEVDVNKIISEDPITN